MPDFEAPRKASASLWVTAALAAVLLHAGCVALALAHMRFDDSQDALGAPALEIDMEMASPHREITDLPPGPDSEASVASPDAAAQEEVVKPSELPMETPVESEDPDRVVTPDKPVKVAEEEPKPVTTQAVASVESVAAEATALPTIEAAKEAERSVAPEQGTGESAARIRATWQKELIAHLNKHRRYPADRSNKSARIVVAFVLDRTGHVLSARIAKSSGDSAFDQAALSMLHRSDPVPAPPPLVADEGLSFTLPVNFRVKGESAAR
jgi:TonB family protein